MKASEAKERSREASNIYTKWQSLSTQTKPVPMVNYVVLLLCKYVHRNCHARHKTNCTILPNNVHDISIIQHILT